LGSENKYREMLEKAKCCLIIPTFNNAAFLGTLLDEAGKYCRDVIVVNDGSTDDTDEILKNYPGIRTIRFESNHGKGHALKAGFALALQSGFDHAITMDSDSQHRPGDLAGFAEALTARPGTLLIGSRNLQQENMPAGNRFANRLSSFWFRIETRIRLSDTQTGFRLYPIRDLEGIRLFTGRYEFELEVLVKAAWKGIPLEEIPVDVYYPPGRERVSHFRPFRDFLRISLLNTWLVLLGLMYFRPRNAFRRYRGKSFKQILREDVLGSDSPRYKIALSIAFGIFMGILPIWGYQLVIGLFFAHLFRLNKALVFIAANISIPPMIPAILYLSYVTGSYVLGYGSWTVDMDLNLASIGQNLKQYVTGAVVFATLAGVVSWALTYLILVLLKRYR
jgi:glycosyltransferase involved in cell wall biosynthesis